MLFLLHFIFFVAFNERNEIVECLSYVESSNFQWKLRNSNGSINVIGRVPGGIYTDLLQGGILEDGDFYYRFNDIHYRYISYDNWTYSTYFQIPETVLREKRIVMEFEGLDTIATIKINGRIIGQSNNMFVKYLFDLKHFLKKNRKQKLDISFVSPVKWAEEAYRDQLKDYLVPPTCVDPAFKGECHANHIRKMQASFGWDWGPAFPSMGVWKPFNIIGWSSIKIENVICTTIPNGELNYFRNRSISWKVLVKVNLRSASFSKQIYGKIVMELNGKIYLEKNASLDLIDDLAVLEDFFIVPEGEVETWWPNTYGQQPLYNMTVAWKQINSIQEAHQKTIRVGFRTVVLDQEFINPQKPYLGRHFRFVINNEIIFMRGSNWIPSHALPELMTTKQAIQLLKDAAETHQNCLRVWGGGVYESDEFYDAADELGILIWQDFMFACSMYPTKGLFLNSVKEEVETQVNSLQHHPSILLWAGNNENEAALRGNWYGTQFHFDRYKKDYVKLYVDIIRKVTQLLDPHRPFVVSSPSNGLKSEEEGYVANHPYDNKYGDVHFYNYVKNAWDWKIYPKTRFASEYGFQSWPSFSTLSNVTTSKDWSINSSMMNHRQHHPFGNTELKLQLMKHFDIKHLLYSKDKQSFKHYIYLTQVHQAMAVRTETEFYRRSKSNIDDRGEGFTSGALYWQLNDIWQGASWSSIEFGGRWKLLHYFAKHFFRPVLLSPWIDNDTVKISVINDLPRYLENATLVIKVFTFKSFTPLSSAEVNIAEIKSQESKVVNEKHLENDLHLSKICRVGKYEPRYFCFLHFELKSDHPEECDQMVDQISYLLLSDPKYATLEKAQISTKHIANTTNGDFRITLETNSVALFVFLEADVEGVFSENGFLMSEPSKVIFFQPRSSKSLEEFRESFTITSLTDSFDPSN